MTIISTGQMRALERLAASVPSGGSKELPFPKSAKGKVRISRIPEGAGDQTDLLTVMGVEPGVVIVMVQEGKKVRFSKQLSEEVSRSFREKAKEARATHASQQGALIDADVGEE